MCFCSTASFGASALLAVSGIISLKVATKKQRLFAAIPLLFALQQSFEGFVWLSFVYSMLEPYRMIVSYGFLLFAFVIWPFWVPLSIATMEKGMVETWKERLLQNFVGAGCLMGLLLGLSLFFYSMAPTIVENHILYSFDMPIAMQALSAVVILYVAITLLPFFFSHMRYMKIGGVALFISYLVSHYFYYAVSTSVWCFFAAVLSMGIVLVLAINNKE
jgi:hypothetical protein